MGGILPVWKWVWKLVGLFFIFFFCEELYWQRGSTPHLQVYTSLASGSLPPRVPLVSDLKGSKPCLQIGAWTREFFCRTRNFSGTLSFLGWVSGCAVLLFSMWGCRNQTGKTHDWYPTKSWKIASLLWPQVLTSSLWKANWQCPFQAAPAAAPAATMIQEPNTQVGGKSPLIPGAHSRSHDHMVLGDVNLILQVQIEEQIVEARIPRHLDISRHQSLQS